MPRWMRLSLVALLLAMAVAWWALRAASGPPAVEGPAPVSVAPSPSAPSVAPAPAVTPEAPLDEAEAPEDAEAEEEDAEDTEEATGPCIAVEVTANGAPVPGAHVTAALREDEDSYSSLESLDLGPDGRGQSWCEPGTYVLAAQAPGFAPLVLEIVEPAAGAPPVARFRLQPGHTVSGHVLDKDSQQPIAQAQLTLAPSEDFAVAGSDFVIEESSFTTDAQGAFHAVNLTAGTYRLTVKAPGHTSKEVDIRIPRPEHLSIELDGTSRLEGQVVDSAGAPVPGAVIWMSPNGPRSEKEAPRTDEQGRFAVEVREGTYSVGARAGPLRGLYESKVTVVRGSLIDGLIIRLRPAGRMSGTVFLQSSHQPIEQAFIGLRHVDSGWSQNQVTDATGTFRFEDLLPGEYKLRMYASGQPELVREGLRVESGQELTVELPVVQRATIQGRLTDGLHRPAHGSPVKVVPLGSPETERQQHWTMSDDEGEYSVSGLEPGRYRIEARCAAESPPILREVALQEGEIAHADFSFPEALGELQGVAQLAGGGPLRASVMVSVSQGEGSNTTPESTSTDDSGHFTLQLLPGTYSVSAAYMEAEEPGPAQQVTVEAGKVSRVRLTVSNSLVETQGLVLNSRGEPEPGAQISFMGDELSTSDEADAQGRFSLKAPRARAGGTGILRASSEAEEGELRNVRVGSTGLVVRMVKPTAVRGRVVATQGPPVQGFKLQVVRQDDTSFDSVLRDGLPFAGDTFEQVDLPAGVLQFLVRTSDGRSGQAAVRLAPGQTGNVEVPVGGLGRVLGRLIGPRGAPCSGWIYLDAGSPQQRGVYAGEDGRFELYAIEPGPHTLGFNGRANHAFTLREGETLDLADLNPPSLTSAP